MRVNSPLLLLECQEDYTVLYFRLEDNNEPVVRAFFGSALKDSVKEYFLKDDVTPGEILIYFKYTAGEDSEAEPEDLTELFSGCKILAVIP
jgi:hypothetical protein